MSVQAEGTQKSTHSTHCHTCGHEEEKMPKWAVLLSRASGVAIAIFCAYQKPKEFFTFTAISLSAELLLESFLEWKRSVGSSEITGCSDIGKLISGVSLRPLEKAVLPALLFFLHLRHSHGIKDYLPIVGYFFGVGVYHGSRDLWTWLWVHRNSKIVF